MIDFDDTVEEHVRDTMVAGDFLCDERAVQVVCEEGEEAVKKLIDFGAEFTRDEEDKLHLAREGGHSKHRIVHAADMTGKEIERALLESCKSSPRITFYEHHMAVDLITADLPGGEQRCLGAEVIRNATGEPVNFLACSTLLASAGQCKLNPSLKATSFQTLNLKFRTLHST